MTPSATRTISAVIGAGTIAATLSIGGEPTADWKTLLDLAVVDKLYETYVDHYAEGPRTKADLDEWTPLGDFAKTLPNAFGDQLPKADGWGRDFLIRFWDGELMVASCGPNGVLDLEEESGPGSILTADTRGDATTAIGDDMVLVVGRAVLGGPRTTRRNQRRAMSNLRSLGTAVETYSIDNNDYPVQERGLRGVEFIRDMLAPTYIRTPPLYDGWGNDYLYWSDGKQYVIVSTGADGLLDRRYESGADLTGTKFESAFEASESDVVFLNGQFVQWPVGEGDR